MEDGCGCVFLILFLIFYIWLVVTVGGWLVGTFGLVIGIILTLAIFNPPNKPDNSEESGDADEEDEDSNEYEI